MVASVSVKSVVGIVGAISVLAGRAWAGEPFSLRNALFGHPDHGQAAEFAAPSVARYRADAGHGFILDRVAADEALLKFDDDPEIWALTPTAASRGDVIYKNDMGEPVLRMTRLGGVILFTPDRPEGSAAVFLGQAAPPRPPPVLGPEALLQMMFQASAKASRAAQHLVAFDAPEVTPSSEAIFGQAFFLTAEAFARVSQQGRGGQKLLSRLVDVRFVAGRGPAAALQGPTVEITVAPQMGVAGRPSSERIAEVLSQR